jgi:hypothetical protein
MPWEVLDYPVVRKGTTALGAPALTEIIFDPVPVGYLWRIDQISVGTSIQQVTVVADSIDGVNFSPLSVALYDQPIASGVLPIQGSPLLQFTDPANLGANYLFANFDDQASPLTIRGGDALTICFIGVPAGVRCLARVQYQYLIGTAGKATPVAGAQGVAVPSGI